MLLKPSWSAQQFGLVVDRFRSECQEDAWEDLLLRYSVLRTKGPGCGALIAKKLTNGKGIWELRGNADNHQPRLLFYFDNKARRIVFVHAFMKKGKQDYLRAIPLAQKRRALIVQGEKQPHDIKSLGTVVH